MILVHGGGERKNLGGFSVADKSSRDEVVSGTMLENTEAVLRTGLEKVVSALGVLPPQSFDVEVGSF